MRPLTGLWNWPWVPWGRARGCFQRNLLLHESSPRNGGQEGSRWPDLEVVAQVPAFRPERTHQASFLLTSQGQGGVCGQPRGPGMQTEHVCWEPLKRSSRDLGEKGRCRSFPSSLHQVGSVRRGWEGGVDGMPAPTFPPGVGWRGVKKKGVYPFNEGPTPGPSQEGAQ